MKRLILHIGTHKTGTSAIQAWLEENRNRLREHGVWYGLTDRHPEPMVPAHTSLFWSLVRGDPSFEAEKTAILDEFAATGCHTLILSNEGFSQHTFRLFRPMMAFAETFEITTICFLRRQDLFLEAWWNQRCKQGFEGRPIEEFALARPNSNRTKYKRLLDFWAGFSSVRAFDYDVARQRGAVAFFTEACGLPCEGDDRPVNVSPSMNCAALCNLLNRHRVPYATSALLALFEGDYCRHALGSRLRKRILADNAEDNRRLAERYGVAFGIDMPIEPAEPMRYPSIGSIGRAACSAAILRPVWRRVRARAAGGRSASPE